MILHDSADARLNLRLFTEIPPLRTFKPQSPHYGWIKFIFSGSETEKVDIQSLTDFTYTTAQENDTIHLWYTDQNFDSLTFILSDSIDLRDTLTIQLKPENSLNNLKITAKTPRTAAPHNPDQPLTLKFSHPIQSIDTSKIFLLQDTLFKRVKPKIEIDTLDPRRLIFNYRWQEGKPYQLLMVDSAVTALYGITNDTVQAAYNVFLRKTVGNVIVNVTGMNPQKQYIVQGFLFFKFFPSK